MTAEDRVARLIPWYASGTLDASESAVVEAHLSTCDACRDLLAVARGFRRLAHQVKSETLLDHVQGQRLVEFANDPSALEPDARRFVNSHIQSCSACAEALEILEDLGRTPALHEPGARSEPAVRRSRGRVWQAWIDVWRRMSRTMLHPVPALAYLVALVTFLAILPLRPSAPGTSIPPVEIPRTGPPQSGPPQSGAPEGPAVSFVPPALDLPGEVTFRGNGRSPAPAIIPFRAGAERIALALVAEIDGQDLHDAGAMFRVEVVQGGRLVFEARRQGTDFDRRGRLTLLLDPSAFTADTPCNVRILLVKPGDPRDGEEVYGRSFLLVPEGASPR